MCLYQFWNRCPFQHRNRRLSQWRSRCPFQSWRICPSHWWTPSWRSHILCWRWSRCCPCWSRALSWWRSRPAGWRESCPCRCHVSTGPRGEKASADQSTIYTQRQKIRNSLFEKVKLTRKSRIMKKPSFKISWHCPF